jgi:hypothetical protein
MTYRVVVHIHNEDPFLAEMDAMPDPRDNFVVLRNPRRRDGRSLTFVTEGATHFLYPWSRISFIEVLESGPAPGQRLLTFFREDSSGQ